jgi:tol-pal system protein YbgF
MKSMQQSGQETLGILRNSRFNLVGGRRGRARWVSLLAAIAALSLGTGCVTQGDFLRLQEKVAAYHKQSSQAPDPFARIAQLSTDVDALRQEVRDLQGELELARKEAADALAQVQRTRTALAQGVPVESGSGANAGPGAAAAGGGAAVGLAGGAAAAGGSAKSATSQPDEELAGYQLALDARRSDDFDGCIEHFTTFLQAYPTSGYADDAAYWLADCTYKKEDYKRAVVRFNAVVSVYPESPKAPDALYRQGESLIKLGPKFHEAARTVFKRVQKDYPKSERATEAAGQLQRLGSGSASN